MMLQDQYIWRKAFEIFTPCNPHEKPRQPSESPDAQVKIPGINYAPIKRKKILKMIYFTAGVTLMEGLNIVCAQRKRFYTK